MNLNWKIILFTLLLSAFFSSCNVQDQPNILWITCEDISPHLGSYGDPYAITPNLDKLAGEGIRYINAFANAPVCTPARSTIITGAYASALGTQHLRSRSIKPEGIRAFPEYLREIGYYCSNSRKTDYNFPVPDSAWDESSGTAHWRNRGPDQPFFSVFNIHITHQSRTRYPYEELLKRNEALPESLRHDPQDVILPPYYPDNIEIRNNMAALHTQITLMDIEAKKLLDQLEEDGLSDETIVFFYSDHGDGIPRGKRWLHETGTNIPLIIKFPSKFKHLEPSNTDNVSSRIVGFVDLAPSILNILELEIPDYIQGFPFLGENIPNQNETCYLFSDRVGDVLDMSRALRSENFRYIRNYQPYKPRMQYCDYSEKTPIRTELRRMFANDMLTGENSWLMDNNKPPEELYDVINDPFEMNNLVSDPAFLLELEKMRKQLNLKMISIGDLSFLPESEMYNRAGERSPYKLNEDSDKYDLERILSVANMVGLVKSDKLLNYLDDEDSAIRFWALTGISADKEIPEGILNKVKTMLDDQNASVRIAAAEALFIHRFDNIAMELILKELVSDNNEIVLHASSTLEQLDNELLPYIPQIEAIYNNMVKQVYWDTYSGTPLKHVLEKFGIGLIP